MIKIEITAETGTKAAVQLEQMLDYFQAPKRKTLAGHTKQSLAEDKEMGAILNEDIAEEAIPQTMSEMVAVPATHEPMEIAPSVETAAKKKKGPKKSEEKPQVSPKKKKPGRPPKKKEEVEPQEEITEEAPEAQPENTTEIPTAQVPETPKVTANDVKDALQAMVKRLGRDAGMKAVKEILTSLNAIRISSIEPSKFPAAISAANGF